MRLQRARLSGARQARLAERIGNETRAKRASNNLYGAIGPDGAPARLVGRAFDREVEGTQGVGGGGGNRTPVRKP